MYQDFLAEKSVKSKSVNYIATKFRTENWFILLELLEPVGLKSAGMRHDQVTDKVDLNLAGICKAKKSSYAFMDQTKSLKFNKFQKQRSRQKSSMVKMQCI